MPRGKERYKFTEATKVVGFRVPKSKFNIGLHKIASNFINYYFETGNTISDLLNEIKKLKEREGSDDSNNK